MYILDNDPVMSDESDDDAGGGESHEEMTYRRKYQMLLERCEVLQQDNERLVHRIQQMYIFTRQVRKERKFLMDRLDGYNDNWRQGVAHIIADGVPTGSHSSKSPHKNKGAESSRRSGSSSKGKSHHHKDSSSSSHSRRGQGHSRDSGKSSRHHHRHSAHSSHDTERDLPLGLA